MTPRSPFLDPPPPAHRAGGKRLRWRLNFPRLTARRTSNFAIAAGIAVVTLTVPPMIAHHPSGGTTAHATPATALPRGSAPASSAPPAGPISRRTGLLSRGRPVTASSVEDPSTPASAAVDASLETRWSSTSNAAQWLRVDLGSVATITQVVLAWNASYAKAYRIQTSPDGQTWSTIYSTTTGQGATETLALTGTGRFIRIYTTVRANQWGYSLWEFDVYGSRTVIGCDTGGNEAVNQPITASSVEKGAYLPSWAVDGDQRTRWSSDASDRQWIQLDFGVSQHFCQVVLAWESASATSYQLQVSDDGKQWSTIYSTTESPGGTETLTVSGSGRYLRVNGRKRATAYGYSLWEIVVHTGTNP